MSFLGWRGKPLAHMLEGERRDAESPQEYGKITSESVSVLLDLKRQHFTL